MVILFGVEGGALAGFDLLGLCEFA